MRVLEIKMSRQGWGPARLHHPQTCTVEVAARYDSDTERPSYGNDIELEPERVGRIVDFILKEAMEQTDTPPRLIVCEPPAPEPEADTVGDNATEEEVG